MVEAFMTAIGVLMAMQGIERNQNTAKYGKANMADGIWRDHEGE